MQGGILSNRPALQSARLAKKPCRSACPSKQRRCVSYLAHIGLTRRHLAAPHADGSNKDQSASQDIDIDNVVSDLSEMLSGGSKITTDIISSVLSLLTLGLVPEASASPQHALGKTQLVCTSSGSECLLY